MADVFVSYSRRDSDFVGRLAGALRARGKDVWVDVEGIRDAEVFPAALRGAVESSHGFLFVISPDSVASPFCEQEVEHATELNKRIVPLVLRRVPDENVPGEIRQRNWIPFDDGLDFEAGVERVAQALDTDLDHARQHTRWLLKALEWEGEGRDRSFLLRGAELASAESWLGGGVGKDPQPTALQQEYVFASRAAASRRQRALVAGSVTVAAISLALLLFALVSRHQAQLERTTARSRALAAQSSNQIGVDPELAVLLGTEAVKTKPTPEAMLALRQAIDRDPLRLTLARLPRQNCDSGLAPGLAYSPDARTIAESSCDGRVAFVDAQSGRRVREVHAGPNIGSASAYSPDGRTLAVGTKRGIRLLDARTGRSERLLAGGGGIVDLAFSPDGRRLAAAANDGLRLWDVRTGRSRLLAAASHQWVTVAFTRDGRRLLAGATVGFGAPLQGTYLFDPLTGRRLLKLPGTTSADALALSPDGERLAIADMDLVGGGDGTVTVRDTRTWSHAAKVVSFPALEVTRIAFSPDGRQLAIGAADGTAGIWQATGRHLQLFSFLGHTAAIAGLDFRPRGHDVATASVDGTARVWRTAGRERLDLPVDIGDAAVTSHELVTDGNGRVQTFALPGGRRRSSFSVPEGLFAESGLSTDGTLVLVEDDRSIALRRIPDGRTVRRMRGLARGELPELSTDKRLLAILRPPPAKRIGMVVDLRTGRRSPLAGPLPLAIPTWRTVAFTRDDRLMAAGTFEGPVVLWDPRTGRNLGSLTNRGQVSQLSFSADGRLLAVGSWDGTVTIWDPRTRRELRVLHGPARGVSSAVFSRAGDWLAAGSLDHTVTLWDTRTWRIARVIAHPDVIGPITFSPDGRLLLTSDNTRAVRLWDPCPGCRDPSALLAEARHAVTRGLTPEERATFLSGV